MLLINLSAAQRKKNFEIVGFTANYRKFELTAITQYIKNKAFKSWECFLAINAPSANFYRKKSLFFFVNHKVIAKI